MGLLDTTVEEPKSKARRYIISGSAFVILVGLAAWYMPPFELRFHSERSTARAFFNALVNGETQRAYQLWQPTSSYLLKDFLDDWGPSGYWGPVKSFHIQSVSNAPRDSNCAVVIVEVSPFAPFPAENDAEKNRRAKVVRIWVERANHSLSFPP